MFPGERGRRDDRAVRIAKTHGVRAALASFAGLTGSGYAMSFGDLGPDGVVQVQAGAAAGEVVSVTLG
jgi:hypothetical protein